METKYYQDLLTNINVAIDDGKYDYALELINEEFKMPYIPIEIEEQLKSLINDIKYYLNNVKSMSEEEILNGLKSEKNIQIKAIDNLCKLNLREYYYEIQLFFNSKPDFLIQALLIDSLISQEINHEFMVLIDDKECNINFSNQIQGVKTESFEKIDNLLKEFFIDNEPSTYQLCLQLLIQECFIRTPFNIKLEDCDDFANKIAVTVIEMLGQNIINYNLNKQMSENVNLKCLNVAF
jgi:hypothetical protein